MRYITDLAQYKLLCSLFNRLIDESQKFPERVFRDSCGSFLFIAFDRIFTREFYSKAREFLLSSGEKTFLMSVIDPHPVDYYYKHFSHYGTIEYTIDDCESEYLYGLNLDPGGSPADALIHSSNRLVVMPQSSDWVIVGDRDLEIAVCAFQTLAGREAFSSIFEEMLLPGATAAADFSFYGDACDFRQRFIDTFGSEPGS